MLLFGNWRQQQIITEMSKYSDYLNFPADYMECIMMIPQAEIDNNPNMSADDQNPYKE